ncbi:hypothetical protein H4R21_002822, partial [Coemansia helicoidea]
QRDGDRRDSGHHHWQCRRRVRVARGHWVPGVQALLRTAARRRRGARAGAPRAGRIRAAAALQPELPQPHAARVCRPAAVQHWRPV